MYVELIVGITTTVYCWNMSFSAYQVASLWETFGVAGGSDLLVMDALDAMIGTE